MNSNIIAKLTSNGFRMTKARASIINLLNNSEYPMTTKSIYKTLLKIGSKVNITTVYREIDFLLSQNIVQKIPLVDKELHYEINSGEHHHHLICESCGQIKNIILQSEPKLLEEARKNMGNFIIKGHLLTFHGVCNNCN